MNQSTESDVLAIIGKHRIAEGVEVTSESTLKDLGVDSLDAIEILFEIEEHFDVTLPDRDPDFDTNSVQGLIDAVDVALQSKVDAKAVVPAPVATL